MARILCWWFLFASLLFQPARGQYLYLSQYPDGCEAPSIFNQESKIYLYAPGIPDVMGVTFQIESDCLGPEDLIAFTPESGIFIAGGDLFQGITLYWAPGVFIHSPILTLTFANNPPYQVPDDFPVFRTTGVVLLRSTSGNLAIEDCYSYINMNIDCFSLSLRWHIPDTVDVVIDTPTDVQVRYLISAAGMVGSDLEITDEQGWIKSWNPHSVFGTKCVTCPWDWRSINISIEIPPATPALTLNRVLLQAVDIQQTDSFILRANEKIPVEDFTFGRFKALFKKE